MDLGDGSALPSAVPGGLIATQDDEQIVRQERVRSVLFFLACTIWRLVGQAGALVGAIEAKLLASKA